LNVHLLLRNFFLILKVWIVERTFKGDLLNQHQMHNRKPDMTPEENAELGKILNQLSKGYFSPGEPGLFYPVVRSLLEYDRFFVLADYESYIKCQEKVVEVYRDEEQWTKMAILNVARSGKFSSDRAIREYAENIWNIQPLEI